MTTPGSITNWIDRLKEGDPEAAQELWQHRLGGNFAASPLLAIEGLGPVTRAAGMFGKLVEGLTPELGTGQAPMDPMLVATLLGDRGDPVALLNLEGGLKPIPIRAKRRQ